MGDFAPFHIGHQRIIETAVSEMNEVILVLYESGAIGVPLQIRTSWIRTLHPEITVLEVWDWHYREINCSEGKYIQDLMAYNCVTHFFSCEPYDNDVVHPLNAIYRRCDLVPGMEWITTADIRKNAYKLRNMLDPVVYRDLITKVVFMGAISTGKSTIVETLAKRYNTTFASEFGRDYWMRFQVDRRLGPEELNEIAIGHIAREEKAFQEANKYCFVDTNAITTYMFALDYHGNAPEMLEEIANNNIKRYDLFFLCEDDIPYDDTWDRSGDQKRHVFQKQIIADLMERNIPFIRLRGDLNERILKVEKILKRFSKYNNFFASNL